MAEPRILIDTIGDVAPLDAQFGVDVPLSRPEVLADHPLADAPRLVALVDGGRIMGLPELIEAQGLPATSLFQPSDDYDDTAPWLVDLAGDPPLLRALMTGTEDGRPGPGAFWFADAAIYFSTDVSLSALRTHLRRFLRVVDPSGKAFFFRIWEAPIVAAYFAALNGRPHDILRWFAPREGGRIDAILAPAPLRSEIHVVSAENIPDPAPAAKGNFTLERVDVEAIGQARTDHQMDRLAASAKRAYPQKADGKDMPAFARDVAIRLHELGIRRMENVFVAMAWALHYGTDWETMDSTGRLAQVLFSSKDEQEKMAELKSRMIEIETD